MIGQTNNNRVGSYSQQDQRVRRGPQGPQGPGQNQGPPPPRRNDTQQDSESFSGNSNPLGSMMRSQRAQGQNSAPVLSSEQQSEIAALKQQAQADGEVTGEERRAIGDKLKSYRDAANSSTTNSSSSSNSRSAAGNGPFANLDLTDSQRSEIHELAEAGKSDGQFTHEERENIHQMVEGMVGHSIPRPQGPPPGTNGVGSPTGISGFQQQQYDGDTLGLAQFGTGASGFAPQYGGDFLGLQQFTDTYSAMQQNYGASSTGFSGSQQFQSSLLGLQNVYQGFLGSY